MSYLRLVSLRRARWLVALIIPVALLTAACTPAPPTPNGDWQMFAFNNTFGPKSCAATPAPDLTNLSMVNLTLAVENVDGVSDNVVQFAAGSVLYLAPTTGEVGNATYSVVVLFRFSSIPVWARVLDFKHSTSDSGVYLHNGHLDFAPVTEASPGPKTVAANEWVQVTVTRTAGGIERGYVDGTKQWEFTDTAGDGIIDDSNALIFFLDNQTGGGSPDEEAGGAVARIRVFDHALSQTQINALGQTPNTPCPT